MPFNGELADIRFGCGLSPLLPPPISGADMLEGLRRGDDMAQRFAVPPFAGYARHLATADQIRAQGRKTGTQDAARRQIVEIGKALAGERMRWFAANLLRWSHSETPLRERLTLFWADHFTARGKTMLTAAAGFPYIEEAIRPNLTGRFADLLVAATTHPLMLHYLDQARSVGPNSPAAARAKRLGGLNENLAREVLELHTLGVNGPYTQGDVRQLAELFTGLSYRNGQGFKFRAGFAEPGAETVLGRQYGGDRGALAPVLSALHDLATHPATARHIAGKLAVHFVSDLPDPALVDHVAARFLQTGGDLLAVYGALLEHPAAWTAAPGNVKPPFDFVASACRALALRPERMAALTPRQMRRGLLRPLRLMGQPLLRPNGPDGWPESDSAWITPQGVSARLRWAVAAPQMLQPQLPDPRAFVRTALGVRATAPVRFAAKAAESRPDAIGLVLAAPAFQRR